MKNRIQNSSKNFLLYIIIIILIWSISVISSLVWNIFKTNSQAVNSAELSARNSLNRDQAMRFWFAKHGGIYLKTSDDIYPITSITDLPNRDIVDMDNGFFYTLYDPATILKRMMEEFPDLYKTTVRIVGNHPLNKNNIPDKHEQGVLLKMEQGLKFSTDTKQVNGKKILQVMYPLWAKIGCLSCHKQKLKVGDLVGAGGVQIDMSPFLVSANSTIRNLLISHILIWVLGLLGIIIFYKQVKFWVSSHLILENKLLESQANLEFRVELRTKELNKLFVAVESSPAIILITDLDNKIEYVNPVFTKVTGYDKEEVIGQSPSIFKSDLNDPGMYKQMWAALNSKGVWYGDFCNKRKDGSLYWVSSAMSPVFSDTGQIQNYVAIQEDITEKKHIELELIKAKENAESSNRAKSEFLSNMSHELRTPLNAILGFAELFDYDKLLESKHKNNAKKIHSAGEYLLKLINSVLDLSKIDSGQLSINNEVILAENLIDECIKLLNPIANDKNISIHFTPQLCDTKIYADYTRTKQVLLNLLSNAIKYNKENGQVNINCNANKKDYLQISIVDTGIGISMEKQKHLFEPFNRLGAEQSNIEGTGVGLHITRKLIEMMNGKIGFESNQKSGTSFWIELPVKNENKALHIHNNASQTNDEKLNNKNLIYSGIINKHVLYLDNNISSIHLMEQIFDGIKNVNFIQNNTLNTVIDVLINKKCLIIIIDTDNLGEDSIDKLIQLQKHNNLGDIPVMAIGTHVSINKHYSNVEYVSKPIDIMLLISRIADMHEKKREN